MKFLIIFSLVLFGFIFIGFDDDLAFAQFSNQNTIKVSFENNVASSYEIPIAGENFSLIQSYSWVRNEISRYNLVSYTLDGETERRRSVPHQLTLVEPTLPVTCLARKPIEPPIRQSTMQIEDRKCQWRTRRCGSSHRFRAERCFVVAPN